MSIHTLCTTRRNFLLTAIDRQAKVDGMTATTKPLKHFCICGRGFTTSSGAKHHYAVCPQEQARSAAYVAWIESQVTR